MGKFDNATKVFFSNKENLVSVIKLFYGWDISSENVDELSERLFTAVEGMNNLKSQKIRKNFKILEEERDVVKQINIGGQRLIIGLENQQSMDCSEPIRVMGYDFMEYEKQRRIIRFIHREKKDLQEDEYVAGFSECDLVVPVHTLVIYYGQKSWKRPKRLSDIWEKTDHLPQNVQDYKIDVLDVRRLTDEQIDSIESDVRLLFGCVKYDDEPEKMSEFIEKNKARFENMLRETFIVLAIMTDSTILQEKIEEWEEKGGRYNMCKAFEEWCNTARREGETSGIQKGIQALVESCKVLGATKEKLAELLKDKFSLEEPECEKYIEMYW